MRVLWLTPFTSCTGNAVTSERICSGLSDLGVQVTLRDVHKTGEDDVAAAFLDSGSSPDVVVGVHGVRSGPLLLAVPAGVPTVLLLSGTDVGVTMARACDAATTLLLTRVVQRVSAAVCFHPDMLRRFQSFCADVLHVPAPPITAVVPQAVDDCAAIADASASTPSLRATIGVASDAVVVLLPCGLRRVKAPTFAVSEFQRWHATSPNVYLVIVGPELDPAVVEEMRAITSADPTGAVRVLGPVPRPVLLGWMRQSDVVLNTSESEGMCGSIMEAMALKVPVVARWNDGNAALLQPSIAPAVAPIPSPSPPSSASSPPSSTPSPSPPPSSLPSSSSSAPAAPCGPLLGWLFHTAAECVWCCQYVVDAAATAQPTAQSATESAAESATDPAAQPAAQATAASAALSSAASAALPSAASPAASAAASASESATDPAAQRSSQPAAASPAASAAHRHSVLQAAAQHVQRRFSAAEEARQWATVLTRICEIQKS